MIDNLPGYRILAIKYFSLTILVFPYYLSEPSVPFEDLVPLWCLNLCIGVFFSIWKLLESWYPETDDSITWVLFSFNVLVLGGPFQLRCSCFSVIVSFLILFFGQLSSMCFTQMPNLLIWAPLFFKLFSLFSIHLFLLIYWEISSTFSTLKLTISRFSNITFLTSYLLF